MDVVDRKRTLDEAVVEAIAHERGRVVFQTDEAVVLALGRPVNHLLHLALTLLTGVWVVVWIGLIATNDERTVTIRVDDTGQVRRSSDRTRTTGTVRWPRVGAAVLVVAGLAATLLGASPWRWGGLALAIAGVTLMVVDIRRYGTARTVTVPAPA